MCQNLWRLSTLVGEGGDMIESIIQVFSPIEKKQRKDLKIKHLMKAVLAGGLNEEVINS